MKTSAIIRIITWSIVAIFLVVVLVNSINGDGILGLNIGFSGYSYSNSSKYLVADGLIGVNDIRNIDIDWISGKVRVEEYNGDRIEFYEENSSGLDEDEKMRYLVENGNLKIKFKKSKKIASFLFNNSFSKTLIIKIPSSLSNELSNFEVDCVSSKVEIDNLIANNISIEAVSGEIDINNVISEALNVETVSGNVNISGNIDFIENESVSGKIMMDLDNCPKEIKSETVSGSINISIPENEGFTAKYESLSAKFTSDFEVNKTKDEAIYKNGESNFVFESVSGRININKK